MDPRTNTVAWQKNGDWSLAHGNGILTTAGRVMFQGRPDGALVAMDDTNGNELWSYQCRRSRPGSGAAIQAKRHHRRRRDRRDRK
jgi:outer membrane protein assembly factor BamB